MCRIPRALTIGAALAVVSLLVALTAACALPGSSSGQGSTTVVIPTFSLPPFQAPPVHTTPGPLVGAAAIKPHLSGVPAFTTQDMADYAKGHLPGGGGTGRPSFTIVRNEFLPSQDISGLLVGLLQPSVEVSARLGGAATLRSDGSLLGFLEAQGTFAFASGVPDSGQTYPYAFEVFDGKSGNLLIYGGLKQPVPNQPPMSTPTPQPTPQSTPQSTPQPTQAPNPPKLSVTASSSSAFCLNNTYPTITVKNTGGGTLTWSGSGPSSPPVTLSPSSGSLAAGGSTVVHVSGSHPGPTVTITFTSNGGNATVTFTCI